MRWLMKALLCVGCWIWETGASGVVPTREVLTVEAQRAYLLSEQERVLPGAFVMEQRCPEPLWLDPTPRSDWATLELGLSYPLGTGAKAGLHPYSRYTCPQTSPPHHR